MRGMIMGNAYLIRTYGPGENPVDVRELGTLAKQGANIHLEGNGNGPTLTIAEFVPDKQAFNKAKKTK